MLPDTPRLDLPDAATVARRLTAALEGLSGPLFAVMDGALFDDLPGELGRAGITARSLFLDHADKEVERAGPWLVPLPGAAARSHVEGLAATQPCAVFWECPNGDLALWRHLRKLNRALIPIETGTAPEGGEPSQDGAPLAEPTEPGHEAVLFRHWDPNVLGAVLPLLDAAQFARVFGPATSIVMYAQDHGGLLHAPRPEGLPPPAPGMLKLRPEQMDGLREVRVRSSRVRIARFLRKTAPDHTENMSDAELVAVTDTYAEQAKIYGIGEERAQTRFSWLMLCSEDKFAKQPEIDQYLRHGPGAPSSRINLLAETMAEAATRNS